MPRVNINKHQKGGTLGFLIGNDRFDVDEEAMDAQIHAFIQSDSRLKKNSDAILKEYGARKSTIREGANANQFYNIDTGGDQVIGMSTNLDLTNEQRGLTNKGKTAKLNIFGNSAGISGAVNKFIGDSVSRAYNQHLLDAESKRKLDEDLAKEKQLKSEEDAKQEKQRSYSRLISNLNLGNSFYGVQLGEGNYSDSNYKRYHSGKDPDRKLADVNYFNQLADAFGNEDLVKDQEFSKFFSDKTGVEFSKFQNTLKGINSKDPNFNMQSAMDKLGLGADYSMMKDGTLWKNMQSKPATTGASNTGGGGNGTNTGGGNTGGGNETIPKGTVMSDGSVSNGDGTFTTQDGTLIDINNNPIINESDVAPEISEENGQVIQKVINENDVYSTFSPNYYKYSNLIDYNGKKYTAEQYLDLEKTGGFTDPTLNALANNVLQKYEAAKQGYSSDNVILKNGWSDFSKISGKAYNENLYDNPYYRDSWGIDDISNYNDVTSMFSGATDKDGKSTSGRIMQFSIVDEKLKNGDIRSRYIDKNGEYLGYYEIAEDGTSVFKALDGNNNVIATKKLGKVSSDALTKNQRSGKNTYYWKSALKKHNIKKKVIKPGMNPGLDKLNSILTNTNTGRYKPFNKKGGVLKFQEGGQSMFSASKLLNNRAVLNHTEGRNASGVNVETLFDSDYKLSEADKMELTGLSLDLTGLITGLATGNTATGLASAGLGAMGTHFSHKAAEARGEEVGWGSKALSYGLDAASAIPLLGTAAKGYKTVKGLNSALRILKYASKGLGIAGLSDAVINVQKGDYSVSNLQTIMSGVSALLANRKSNTRKALEYDPNKNASKTLKGLDGNKVKINLSEEQAKGFRNSRGNKQLDILKQAIGQQGAQVNLPKQRMIFGNKLSLDGESKLLPTFASPRRIKEVIKDTNNNYVLKENATDKQINRSKFAYGEKDEYSFGDILGANPSKGPDGVAKDKAQREENIKKIANRTSSALTRLVGGTKSVKTESNTSTPASTPASTEKNTVSNLTEIVKKVIGLTKGTPAISVTNRGVYNTSTNMIPSPAPTGTNISPYLNKYGMKGTTTNVGTISNIKGGTSSNVKSTSETNFKNAKATDKPYSIQPSFKYVPASTKGKSTKKVTSNRKAKKLAKKAELGMKLMNPFNIKKLFTNNINTKINIPTFSVSNKKHTPFKINAGVTDSILPRQTIEDKLTNSWLTSVEPKIQQTHSNENVKTSTAIGKDPGFKAPKDTRKSFNLNANPYDISEGARALNKILTTNKIDTRVEAPLMSNTLEIAPSIKSNVGLKGMYGTMANRLRSVADANVNSDAGLNLVGKLSANAKANEFELQGATQDAESILRQQDAASTLARQYAANRTAVANQNTNTIANKIQSERGLKNERIATNLESVDNLWASMNAKGIQRDREASSIKAQIAGNELLNNPLGTLGSDLGLDPNKSYTATLMDLTRQIESNNLLQKEAQGQLGVEEKALLSKLRTQTAQLENSMQVARLQKQLDLLGGKKSLFNFKYGARPATTIGVTGTYAKGGKLSFEEKLILQEKKESAKKETAWIKEYNNFIKDKSDYFLKATAPSANAVNKLITNLYKKNG